MHSHWLRNILVILIIVQITMMILFFQNYHFVDQALYNEVSDTKSLDVLNVAVQLGRFDLASFFLAGIGVFISLAAIFAFIEVRSRAERSAKDTAKSIASDVTHEVAQQVAREVAQEVAERVARLVVQERVVSLYNEALKSRGAEREADLVMSEKSEEVVLSEAEEIGAEGNG